MLNESPKFSAILEERDDRPRRQFGLTSLFTAVLVALVLAAWKTSIPAAITAVGAGLGFTVSAKRGVRSTLVGAVIGVVVIWAIAFVWSVLSILTDPFGGADEFIGVGGSEAKSRLAEIWPSMVDPSDVQSLSCKTESSRDSYSSWFKIKLLPAAAEKWQDDIHAQQESSCNGAADKMHEPAEGVRREVNGPPPFHRQTGTTPAWWLPPPMPFRATEAMLWYQNYNSGVARATYSGFDPASSTLWVYQYACQHDQLWSPGVVPAGRKF